MCLLPSNVRPTAKKQSLVTIQAWSTLDSTVITNTGNNRAEPHISIMPMMYKRTLTSIQLGKLNSTAMKNTGNMTAEPQISPMS